MISPFSLVAPPGSPPIPIGFPCSVTQSVASQDKCAFMAVFLGIPFSLVSNLTKLSSIAITIEVSISPP